jgi:hypothetical protein
MLDLPGWLRGDGAYENIEDEHDDEKQSNNNNSNPNSGTKKSSPSSNRPPPDVRDSTPSTPLIQLPPKTPDKKGNDVRAELDELDEDCCFCPLDPILWWFALFTVISGMAAFAGLLINVVYIAKHRADMTDKAILLRVYATVFSGVICLIEIDWRFLVSRLRIFDLWLIRGAFYGYVGLITCSEIEKSLSPLNVIGSVIASVGVVYMVMGLCCMKTVRIRHI